MALTQIRDEPKETAVDLGCGTGHALIKMRQLGFQQLMGVDISSEMLSAAASLVEENQLQDVQLVNADVQNIALLADDSVDVCTALGVIEYLDEDGPLLAEIERILKPGGVAIIQQRNQDRSSRTLPGKLQSRRTPARTPRRTPAVHSLLRPVPTDHCGATAATVAAARPLVEQAMRTRRCFGSISVLCFDARLETAQAGVMWTGSSRWEHTHSRRRH